jgi:hypothetical protein
MRRVSDLTQSLLGQGQISAFDEHAQMRHQGDDLHQPMPCRLGLDEQLACALTGGEDIPSSDQYANQNGADEYIDLMVVRL